MMNKVIIILCIISIIGTIVEAIKTACTLEIPAENWANRELYHKDIMDGVSIEQRMKNVENGKYKYIMITDTDTQSEYLKEIINNY